MDLALFPDTWKNDLPPGGSRGCQCPARLIRLLARYPGGGTAPAQEVTNSMIPAGVPPG
jgi:hypothetical protein